MKYIKFLKELRNTDISSVGGKNASLGELYNELMPEGIKVPNSFAITADAYWYLLKNSEDEIRQLLKGLDTHDIKALNEKSKKIRELLLNSPFPKDLEDEILKAYKKLSLEYEMSEADVAVRSSATAEDLPDASFAGQQDTYLNIKGEKELLYHIKACFASLFTSRAISYRERNGFDHLGVALSVGVQKMARSDLGAAGVMFSCDTESGFKDAVFITSSFGLGESVVAGLVDPDEFYVYKNTLKQGFAPIIKRQLGHKKTKIIYHENATKSVATSEQEFASFSLKDEDLLTLAKYAMIIEEHYTKEAGKYRPMDIEWAKDGQNGEIYIVQARPETVHSRGVNVLESYHLKKDENELICLVSGKAIGAKIGAGRVRILKNAEEMSEFKEGEVLVTDNTDPDWEPIMKKAAAIITNRGGRTCHAAIVAREIGVPTVVGAINATNILKDGCLVTLSCANGEEGRVYEGLIPFHKKSLKLDDIGRPRVKIYANVANPKKAFSFAQLPSDGVGLARMELIMINQIKAHPLALQDLYEGKDEKISKEDKARIKELIKGYKDEKDFFISKIEEGIGMICAAYYPRPVIVRFSDFKSNEYKGMIGGTAYEPTEENPMLGWRGASRYYDSAFVRAFAWEVQALSRVRSKLGLKNMKVMIPFLRTPQEGLKVLKLLAENGLKQHEDGLEVYIMCELPVNVILADEFLKLFDGFSIGSNDLTQLVLGVDRDGELVSHIFDERNPAMLKLFKDAIDACKRAGKYCGICGQAPSDYIEVAEFLVKAGIDSISLNPDCIIDTWTKVVKLEEGL